jgi:hypothetical protein
MNYHDLYDNWARNAEIAKKFTEDFKEEWETLCKKIENIYKDLNCWSVNFNDACCSKNLIISRINCRKRRPEKIWDISGISRDSILESIRKIVDHKRIDEKCQLIQYVLKEKIIQQFMKMVNFILNSFIWWAQKKIYMRIYLEISKTYNWWWK